MNEQVEEAAKLFYSTYCDGVGGKAFNGDPLPSADEFFADPNKQKQVDAYRLGANALLSRFGGRND